MGEAGAKQDPVELKWLMMGIMGVLGVVFTTLMGDQVEPRREFIQSNALEVSTLDI